MTIRNRELSQFGSFIYVENSTQKIGITTGALPNVGIGTTNPQVKLDVIGNANVSGIISATGFYLNGSELVNAELSSWTTSESNIYRESGNVGIGSTIPSQKLDVNGSIKASQFNSTVSSPSPPFIVNSSETVSNLSAGLLGGKLPPSGDIVGTTDTQILANKTLNLSNNTLSGTVAQFNTALSDDNFVTLTGSETLTNKTLNLSNNTISGTVSQFNTALSDDNFVTLTGSETLTNKTLTSPTISSIVNSGAKTIPTGIGTFVITGSVGLVTSGMIADGAITNADVAIGAGIETGKLSAFTISGTPLGGTLPTLTFGTYLTGTSYNSSSTVTLGLNASPTDTTGNTVVVRSSGDFSGRVITASSSVRDSSGNVRTIPQNSQGATYTLTISDIGKHVNISAGAGVTVPTNTFSTGDAITVFNNTAIQKTVSIGAGITMRLAGTATVGQRFLSQYALATILCISNNVFTIVGAGVT